MGYANLKLKIGIVSDLVILQSLYSYIYIYIYLNGAKDCTHNKTYFSPFFLVQLNINKGFHGICESQNNDWDCKNQSINLLHLVINLFYMHWFFKYITYLNGFRNLA